MASRIDIYQWTYRKYKNNCLLKNLKTKSSRFFFDLLKSPIHEIYYVMHSYVIHLVILNSATIDALCCGLCMGLIAQFQILKIRIESLKFNELKSLQSCINHHQKLVELCNELNSMYRPIIFFEYSTIAFNICLTGLQLILVTNLICSRIVF